MEVASFESRLGIAAKATALTPHRGARPGLSGPTGVPNADYDGDGLSNAAEFLMVSDLRLNSHLFPSSGGRLSRPIYPRTTSGGRRRLWNLPVGESHHLSSTYPPESRERIQVLHCRQVLTLEGYDLGSLEEQVSEYFPARPAEVIKLIGPGIEFLF